jgi:flagellin-like hook-associated protein FlgL
VNIEWRKHRRWKLHSQAVGTGVIEWGDDETLETNILAALEALGGINEGDVTVSVESGVATIEFTGGLENTPVALVIGDNNLHQGDAATAVEAPGVSVDTEGTASADEVQTISFSNIAGGTFTLSFMDEVTVALDFNASAADVEAALEALSTVGEGNVSVGGTAGNWEVSFTGDLAGQDVAELVIDDTGLVGLGSIGDIANSNTAIYDIDRFWDASGNFMVSSPQTITLVQGNGETTSFTIFGTDTIGEIETKLNNAIHTGLGQSGIEGTTSGSYAQYVAPGQAAADGFFSVEGTFVIQSAITGKDGEISFIGDDTVINALSLTTIQQSGESLYTVNVADAHSGKEIASNVKISGNMLVGQVHKNVDVKFDAMSGISFGTTAANGFVQFGWNEAGTASTTYVHLADNTQVFHIGANPLQDIGAAIGDMRSEALGVDNILVTDRSSANRAISQIDNAIGRVSSERSKMGALQNRLEHTINNLGVSAENLTAAESRIRDLDFAMEMIEFTRNQIMMQAGTAMLAQANMKPQSVLMLLG